MERKVMSAVTKSLQGASPDHGWFKTTHWTCVLRAGGNEAAQADSALAELCRLYWYPLYSYIRSLGHGPQDAQDLVQGFFLKLLEKDYIKDANPRKGRFRTFLLMALKRYLVVERDRANSQKRGGGHELISLQAVGAEEESEEHYPTEPKNSMSPERVFARNWALTLLRKVADRLREDYASSGKARLFEELEVYLIGDDNEQTYGEIAEKLGMKEGAVKVAVHRLRRRYRQFLRFEIAKTVSNEEEVDEEIGDLFAVLEPE